MTQIEIGGKMRHFLPISVSLPAVRPMPFHDFTLFVVLSPFTAGSSNAGREYSACVGGTLREKREDNK